MFCDLWGCCICGIFINLGDCCCEFELYKIFKIWVVLLIFLCLCVNKGSDWGNERVW